MFPCFDTVFLLAVLSQCTGRRQGRVFSLGLPDAPGPLPGAPPGRGDAPRRRLAPIRGLGGRFRARSGLCFSNFLFLVPERFYAPQGADRAENLRGRIAPAGGCPWEGFQGAPGESDT